MLGSGSASRLTVTFLDLQEPFGMVSEMAHARATALLAMKAASQSKSWMSASLCAPASLLGCT